MIAPDTNVLVRLEHEDACLAAVAAYAGGMGFADAVHAATAATMRVDFHTFDVGLAGKAEKLLGISVQLA